MTNKHIASSPTLFLIAIMKIIELFSIEVFRFSPFNVIAPKGYWIDYKKEKKFCQVCIHESHMLLVKLQPSASILKNERSSN